MSLVLPDVSEFQPGTNMAGVKRANGGAVIIRAGYSTTHKDLSFAKHRTNAHAAQMKAIGIYHYVVPSAHSASAHAAAFCSWVGKRQANEFFVLDLEEGGGNLASWAKTWTSAVQKKLGGHVLVYSGESFMGTHGLTGVMGATTGWIAAYGSNAPSHPHLLWQSTDGKIGSHRTAWDGAGYCDTSYYPGSLAQFAKIVGGSAVPDTEEDEVTKRISVGWSGTYKPGANVWHTAKSDVVYEDDNKERAKNGVSSATLFSHAVSWRGEATFEFSTLDAQGVDIRVVQVDAKTGKEILNISGQSWHPGSGGATSITQAYVSHRNEKSRKTYVQYRVRGNGTLTGNYFKGESVAL